jgi:hypothetical protein
MTRSGLKRTLWRVYAVLATVLAISLVSKFVDHIPALRGSGFEVALKDLYEYLKDMSLLIATGGVAYIANVYQQRQGFLTSLADRFREMTRVRSVLFAYTQKEAPTVEEYVSTFVVLSEAIDNMRISYRNVGETDDLIGLYPFAPLHDMRRALQTLDPRQGEPNVDQRNLVRDAILQSFYALREAFLLELDLSEPDLPLLIHGGRRAKKSGATGRALRMQNRQRARQERKKSPAPRIDEMLAKLHDKEEPWQQAPAGGEGAGMANGRGA